MAFKHTYIELKDDTAVWRKLRYDDYVYRVVLNKLENLYILEASYNSTFRVVK